MKLPTKEECLELLKEYNVSGVLLRHIKNVNKISVFLAKKLKEKGIDVDVEALDRASMLHDILKTIEIPEHDDKIQEDPEFFKDLREKFKGLKHEKAASKLLKDKGYDELGELIEFHGFRGFRNLDTWERKILNYADSRVSWDQIVSIQERFDELDKRYGPHNVPNYTEEAKKEHRDSLIEVEKEIFSHLDLKPEDLKEEVEKDNQDE